jgi:hypothetical protein
MTEGLTIIVTSFGSRMEVSLYGADGSSILGAAYIYYYSAGNNNNTFKYTNLAAGTYYIKTNGYGELVGQYGIQWTLVNPFVPAPDMYEPDNTPATAAVLPVDTIQTHSIYPAGDVDWILITLPQAVDINITATPLNGEFLYADLYAADAATILAGYNNLPPADYYIKVYSNSTDIGAYNIAWTVTNVWGAGVDIYEPDNVTATATTLPANTVQTHSINPVNDVDWLAITMTSAGDLCITITAQGSFMQVGLYLADGATQITAMNIYYYSPTNYNDTLTYAGLAPGTYYIKVGGTSTNPLIGAYDIEWSLANTFSLTADAYEPDNTAAQAATLPVDTVQNHSIYPAGDVDWLTITLTQAEDISITVTASNGVSLDTQLYAGDKTTALSGINLPPGRYYIKVAGYSPYDVCNYTIQWTVALVTGSGLDIYEPDDLPISATVLPMNILKEHSINPFNDVDYMVFTNSQTGDVTITVNSNGSYIGVALNSSTGSGKNIKLTQLTYTFDYSPTLTYANLPVGNYYIEVFVASATELVGAYTIEWTRQ